MHHPPCVAPPNQLSMYCTVYLHWTSRVSKGCIFSRKTRLYSQCLEVDSFDLSAHVYTTPRHTQGTQWLERDTLRGIICPSCIPDGVQAKSVRALPLGRSNNPTHQRISERAWCISPTASSLACWGETFSILEQDAGEYTTSTPPSVPQGGGL